MKTLNKRTQQSPRWNRKKTFCKLQCVVCMGVAKEIVEKHSIKQRMQFIASYDVALKIIIKQRNGMNVCLCSKGYERENGIQI